jgi:hypothetical protein
MVSAAAAHSSLTFRVIILLSTVSQRRIVSDAFLVALLFTQIVLFCNLCWPCKQSSAAG